MKGRENFNLMSSLRENYLLSGLVKQAYGFMKGFLTGIKTLHCLTFNAESFIISIFLSDANACWDGAQTGYLQAAIRASVELRHLDA